MPPRFGLGVAAMAALLPWSPFGFRHEASGFTTYLDGPAYVVTAAALAFGGVALAAWDRWLGVFVLAMAVAALASRTTMAMATAYWIAFGAAALVVVREAAPAGVRWVLILTALGQTAVAALQALGHDPLWEAFVFPHGTMGNSKYLGALLAVVTPLAPLWCAALLLAGVILSRSWLAALAVALGLLVRPGVSRRWRLGAAVVALLGLLGSTLTRGAVLYTLSSRLDVWALAMREMSPLALLLGHGPGAWGESIPHLQIEAAAPGWPAELFLQAHSDVFQLWYEGGLVALVLLAGWLWSHRRALLASPWRGAALAVGIEALALHPFHLPTVAPVAVVVLGLATRPASEASPLCAIGFHRFALRAHVGREAAVYGCQRQACGARWRL